MTEHEPLDFRSAAAWRRWLARNHGKSSGEWVYMYKKGAERKGLRYAEALEEALCYGWIDGQLKAVDADKYRQRWTPRRRGSNWSEVNKRKVERLIAAGRMAPPGLREVEAAKREGRWERTVTAKGTPAVGPELLAALKADPQALANFRAFAPSYRRIYAGWIAAARTELTRRRRIEAVVRRARENRKPGIEPLYD